MDNEWYLETLKRVEQLMDINPDPGEPDWCELYDLVDQLEDYEDKEFPIDL